MQQIKTRIKNKINSIQTWETTLSDYVLLNGELAIVSCETENKLKFGDGSTPFYQLPYYGIDLSSIKSTYVDGVECDLSVQHISLSDYANLLNTDQAISNVIYMVSSDIFDACNERITNVATPTDDMDAVNLSTLRLVIETEAKDKGYVLSSRSIAGLKLSSDITTQQLKDAIDLSTYEQTKGQLSADGYVVSTQLGSMAYKLSSDYVLTSTSIVGKELSNNITAADISIAVHLSDYALSDDVSSKVDLEAAFDQKLDATAGAKAFSELSTYSLYEHVSYNGLIWECISAITAAGPWNENNWRITDMTSPDATLDVTNDDRLRVVSADGSIIWQQGYNMTQEQYSAITANIDALSSLVTAANNSLETILNESL